jgi:Putative beta-barrel porin 2
LTTCAVSDLPNLRPTHALFAPAKPLSGRHRWPRIVKPIALGWLLTTAIATAALSQSEGGDRIDDLRARLDAGSGRTLPDGADLTSPGVNTPLYSQGAAPPEGAALRDGQASDPDRTQPWGRLPSLADPVGPALPGTAPTPNVPPRRPAATQDDAFDAPGLRVGAFLLRPAIEVFSGYDSNPARVPGGGGSALLVVAPELQLQSDWTRHELTAFIRGSYNDYPAVGLADRPALNATVDGRIDVTRDRRIELEGRSVLGTDYPGSPNLAADIAKLPPLGVGQRLGRLDVALKGMIDRTTWQDSLLTDGSTASNDDRNFNQVGAELRAAYALTGELKPFIAFDVDTRKHDLPVDRSGLMRDSDGTASRAGGRWFAAVPPHAAYQRQAHGDIHHRRVGPRRRLRVVAARRRSERGPRAAPLADCDREIRLRA